MANEGGRGDEDLEDVDDHSTAMFGLQLLVPFVTADRAWEDKVVKDVGEEVEMKRSVMNAMGKKVRRFDAGFLVDKLLHFPK